MKFKKTLTSILLFSPFVALSCANYSQENVRSLSKIISNQDEILGTTEEKQRKNTTRILENLLNDLFKFNPIRIQKFKEEQEQNKTLIKEEFKKVATEFKNLVDQDKLNKLIQEIRDIEEELRSLRFDPKKNSEEIKENQDRLKEILLELQPIRQKQLEYIQKQNEFYSKNWYYFLTNLNEFEFQTIEYVYDGLQNGKTASSEYKNIIDEKAPYKNFEFKDSFLESMQQGDESKEFRGGVIYYIRKDKLIFRIIISQTDTENPLISIKAMNWYFGNSKANVLSLQVISSVIHALFIHQWPNSNNEFENIMVKKQKYGEPAFVFGYYKGE
ncbi:aromatic motif membrane protein [Mycoplasmopsis felis]|uniref:aromatic motif membrane protein n=1 Tax=Mycoplasmopsis felis TaxID=33923 RepID=UPI002AFF9ED4|nr:aromatic motif membrane protein [Mycoplasmopsis felis]WQQ03199.1 aromatic motif membrane protein [Mycoplasmopsis felis]